MSYVQLAEGGVQAAYRLGLWSRSCGAAKVPLGHGW